MQKGPLVGERGGQHPLARFVSATEGYGPHVVERFAGLLTDVRDVVDLGAGTGRDLRIVGRLHPDARLAAVEANPDNCRTLENLADEVHVLDLERDALPFPDESVDLVIANQILEHTKEIFWITSEISRTLRIGGHLLIGVPNVASLHNRVLLAFGRHPTTCKACSGHVRAFSKRDTLAFFEAPFSGGYELVAFAGSQFYPLPRKPSRIAARLAPSAAVGIFFLLRKRRAYAGEYAAYPARAHLETTYRSRPDGAAGQ